MNTFFKLCSGVALIGSLGCSKMVHAEQTPIVKDGNALGVIVIPEKGSNQLQATAKVLQDYIERSTGVTLPITTEGEGRPALHLGETPLVLKDNLRTDELGRDGFTQKRIDAKNFAIVGGSDWGTEFGVYDFLERYLGIRWLAATELFTEVPSHKTLMLPESSRTDAPVFLSRELFPIEVESDPEDVQRASSPLWYRSSDEWGRKNRLHADIDFHHNLKELLPASKFRDSHPEFYPVFEGKHELPPDDEYYQWQPNFSAPGIAEVSANEIIAYFEKYPDKQSYSLGINDSYHFDGSDESKARRSGAKNSIGLEDISDDYFQWTNEVAELVEKKIPGKKFGLLAYLQVLEPPTRVEVNPAIVPFITYENTRWEDPEYREKMEKVTEAWGKAASTLGWYDYVYGARYLVPRFFPHAEQNSLVWGAAHKVKYYYAEAIPSWLEGPNLWVLNKLLWNPHQDVDVLLDDWYAAAVGSAAAPKLRGFYEIWEKFWKDDIRSSEWYSATNLWLSYSESDYLNAVPVEYLEKSDQLLEEAVTLAETPIQKERAAALQRMWKVSRASVLARQGDELWKSANLQTDADVESYLSQCAEAINIAKDRLRLMGELVDDSLFGHAIYRATSTTDLGDDWGTRSLWALLPFVNTNEKVRSYLESLASDSQGAEEILGYRASYDSQIPMRHKSAEIAKLVLAGAAGQGKPFLQNGSFESGMENWSEGPYEVTAKEVADGKSSLEVNAADGGSLTQFVPFEAGSYFATIKAFVPVNFKTGNVTLTFMAFNDAEVQIGPLLPSGKMKLTPGKWSSLVVPLTLAEVSVPATKLRVQVEFDGFPADGVVYLDDLKLVRTDAAKTTHSGTGPDGM